MFFEGTRKWYVSI